MQETVQETAEEIGTAERIMALEQGAAVGPWTLEIYPTLRCNLDCAFCDTTERHRPPQRELPLRRWRELLEEAIALGARRLMVLGGGEPMISPASLPLMVRAAEAGLRGTLTTNGTLLTPDALARLAAAGWEEIQISIDGAIPDTHDRLRGRPGSFHKAIRAACRLRAIRGERPAPRLVLHTVLTNANAGELTGLIRLAYAVGAARLEVDALVAYRPEQRALLLTEADVAALPRRVAAARAEAARLGVAHTLDGLLQPGSLARGSRAPPHGEAPGLAGAPCLRPWHHLTIQADGRISPCCVLAGEGESLATGSIAGLWARSPYMEGMRAQMRAHRPGPRCRECSENILRHERVIRGHLAPEGIALKGAL